jgi:hypothetical protein
MRPDPTGPTATADGCCREVLSLDDGVHPVEVAHDLVRAVAGGGGGQEPPHQGRGGGSAPGRQPRGVGHGLYPCTLTDHPNERQR